MSKDDLMTIHHRLETEAHHPQTHHRQDRRGRVGARTVERHGVDQQYLARLKTHERLQVVHRRCETIDLARSRVGWKTFLLCGAVSVVRRDLAHAHAVARWKDVVFDALPGGDRGRLREFAV